MIEKLKLNKIDTIKLINAFNNTCKYRNTNFTKEEALKIVNDLIENNILSARWNGYTNKYTFASNIAYKETIVSIKNLISIIYK